MRTRYSQVRNIEQVNDVANTLLAAMKTEVQGRDRQEVKIHLETLLDQTLQRVNEWTSVTDVVSKISSLMDADGHANVDDIQGFATQNRIANDLGNRIVSSTGDRMSQEELLQKLSQLKSKSLGTAIRSRTEMYDRWARSEQPELVHQAKIFAALSE